MFLRNKISVFVHNEKDKFLNRLQKCEEKVSKLWKVTTKNIDFS